MKKLRIAIIAIIIIIIIISSLLYRTLKRDESDSNNIPDEEEIREEDYYDLSLINYTIQIVENRDNYYEIKSIVDKFYTYRFMWYESNLDTSQKEEINNALYSMLDIEYLNNNNMNKNNLIKKIDECDYTDVTITNMNEAQISKNVYIYFINGRLVNRKTSKKKDFYILLKVDMFNHTFSVYLDDFAKMYKNEIGEKIDFTCEEVEKNNYNSFENQTVSDEEYAKDLFNRYKSQVLFDLEYAYKTLDSEYVQKRFGNFEKYKQYMSEKLKQFIAMKLDKYSFKEYKEYNQYICIDQDENYYIFNETEPMKYQLYLDTYTIDLPQFIEKYNKANANGKVALNIQKFIDAINNKDYKFAYNVLSDSYKKRYFSNEENFEKYIKANLFESNDVEYKDFKEENNAYSYKIVLTNAKVKDGKQVVLYIAMQLEESGTGFRIAFSRE